jgi:hypothetical protein
VFLSHADPDRRDATEHAGLPQGQGDSESENKVPDEKQMNESHGAPLHRLNRPAAGTGCRRPEQLLPPQPVISGEIPERAAALNDANSTPRRDHQQQNVDECAETPC